MLLNALGVLGKIYRYSEADYHTWLEDAGSAEISRPDRAGDWIIGRMPRKRSGHGRPGRAGQGP
jgi:hypothetical protein